MKKKQVKTPKMKREELEKIVFKEAKSTFAQVTLAILCLGFGTTFGMYLLTSMSWLGMITILLGITLITFLLYNKRKMKIMDRDKLEEMHKSAAYRYVKELGYFLLSAGVIFTIPMIIKTVRLYPEADGGLSLLFASGIVGWAVLTATFVFSCFEDIELGKDDEFD